MKQHDEAALETLFAGVLPVEHYAHKMMEQIKADIEAANVGVKVKLFPARQLGAGEELLEDTIRGNIDMVHAFVYAHNNEVLDINSLPFLVSSFDERVRCSDRFANARRQERFRVYRHFDNDGDFFCVVIPRYGFQADLLFSR